MDDRSIGVCFVMTALPADRAEDGCQCSIVHLARKAAQVKPSPSPRGIAQHPASTGFLPFTLRGNGGGGTCTCGVGRCGGERLRPKVRSYWSSCVRPIRIIRSI